MVLVNGLGGMSFGGSEVGGFFGNLIRRCLFSSTKLRSPLLSSEPMHTSILNNESISCLTKRTRGLSKTSSVFPFCTCGLRLSERPSSGIPILKARFIMFPKDKTGFEMDEEYYIGSSGLLVKVHHS